jgi:hypothetical protein
MQRTAIVTGRRWLAVTIDGCRPPSGVLIAPHCAAPCSATPSIFEDAVATAAAREAMVSRAPGDSAWRTASRAIRVHLRLILEVMTVKLCALILGEFPVSMHDCG